MVFASCNGWPEDWSDGVMQALFMMLDCKQLHLFQRQYSNTQYSSTPTLRYSRASPDMHQAERYRMTTLPEPEARRTWCLITE
jgi:hypothetical protein